MLASPNPEATIEPKLTVAVATAQTPYCAAPRWRNTIGAKLITDGPLKGVALLYGPSVEQVFATVAHEIKEPLANYLETEFLRQFIRQTSNA